MRWLNYSASGHVFFFVFFLLCLNNTTVWLGLSFFVLQYNKTRRAGPIHCSVCVWWSAGPRQPRQGLNQRPRVITQQNGMDVIPSSHDVTYLAAMQQQNNQLMEVNHIKSPASSIENSKKSELLLDCHQQSQQLPTLLVSSADTSSSVGNGTAAWISSQGHLVTVWTPSGTSLSTGRDQDNNQQQQQQQHSMNLINARVHIRQNPCTVDGCGEAKISSQNVAETKT